MELIEKLLASEAEAYRPIAALLRHCAINVRGLGEYSLDDIEIKIHLDACRRYYDEFGTISGAQTPWLTGRAIHGEEE